MDNENNSGSFMAPVGSGIGPALSQVLAMRNQGQTPPMQAQNSQAPGGIPASTAPMPQGGMPAPQATPIPGAQMQAPPPPENAGPAGGTAPELQIALNALAQYIKSHSKVAEATNGVQ